MNRKRWAALGVSVLVVAWCIYFATNQIRQVGSIKGHTLPTVEAPSTSVRSLRPSYRYSLIREGVPAMTGAMPLVEGPALPLMRDAKRPEQLKVGGAVTSGRPLSPIRGSTDITMIPAGGIRPGSGTPVKAHNGTVPSRFKPVPEPKTIYLFLASLGISIVALWRMSKDCAKEL